MAWRRLYTDPTPVQAQGIHHDGTVGGRVILDVDFHRVPEKPPRQGFQGVQVADRVEITSEKTDPKAVTVGGSCAVFCARSGLFCRIQQRLRAEALQTDEFQSARLFEHALQYLRHFVRIDELTGAFPDLRLECFDLLLGRRDLSKKGFVGIALGDFDDLYCLGFEFGESRFVLTDAILQTGLFFWGLYTSRS